MARCLTPSVRVILLLSLASSLAVPLSAQRTTGRTRAAGAPAPAQPIVRPVTPVTVPAPVTAAAPASAVVRQGVTPQSVVKTSIKAMGPAHGKCVGVVLTMVQPDRPLAEILLRRKS